MECFIAILIVTSTYSLTEDYGRGKHTNLPAFLLPESPIKGPCACGGVEDEERHSRGPTAAVEVLLYAYDGAGVALVLQV